MEERLSPSLAQNKQALKEQFGGTVDLYLKDVQLWRHTLLHLHVRRAFQH